MGHHINVLFFSPGSCWLSLISICYENHSQTCALISYYCNANISKLCVFTTAIQHNRNIYINKSRCDVKYVAS